MPCPLVQPRDSLWPMKGSRLTPRHFRVESLKPEGLLYPLFLLPGASGHVQKSDLCCVPNDIWDLLVTAAELSVP
jgi:hypothetical protein